MRLGWGILLKAPISKWQTIFSALKRARQTETRTLRNRSNNHGCVRFSAKMREALTKGEKQSAGLAFRKTVRPSIRPSKGCAAQEHCRRYKSRLSARLNALK